MRKTVIRTEKFEINEKFEAVGLPISQEYVVEPGCVKELMSKITAENFSQDRIKYSPTNIVEVREMYSTGPEQLTVGLLRTLLQEHDVPALSAFLKDKEDNVILFAENFGYFDAGEDDAGEDDPEEDTYRIDQMLEMENVKLCKKELVMVTPKIAAIVKEALSWEEGDRQEDRLGQGDIISITAYFDDGAQMQIQCCGYRYEGEEDGVDLKQFPDNNKPWIEAVLYRENEEPIRTKPSANLLGEWRIETADVVYIALVESSDSYTSQRMILSSSKARVKFL